MKLAAIYNVWDGEELLLGSIKCLKNEVDLFIIIWQDVSNFGEKYNPLPEIERASTTLSVTTLLQKYTPTIGSGLENEKRKRNIGLDMARQQGCTHFLHLDCDEYYSNFAEAKELYHNSGLAGSVCRMHTYFKKPTLRLETQESYFVPFIHRLHPNTTAGVKHYPFYVDPTRRINETHVGELPITMHHFSWVRKDIDRKARNSSAKGSLARGTLLADYNNHEVGAGFFVRDYESKLVEVADEFMLCGIL